MSTRSPATVVITGATGSIGGALALEYAAPGVTLWLQGRRVDPLQALADLCRARGAQVNTDAFDLRDEAALREWMARCCQQSAGGAPDLLVVNAGLNTNTGPTRAGEAWQDTRALVGVNLIASLAMVDAVLPAMRARGQGQIALVSSLAAYYGLPTTPTYSATKAALKAYGEGLRGWLAPEGLRVNVIMPGYVESPMCEAMPGPKPFLLQPSRAARAIRKGLAADRPRIVFPFWLHLGTWFLAVLPPSVSQRLLRLNGYR